MNDLLAQIRAANEGGLYYAALFPALSLPDICGALEASDGIATRPRYADWFDRHVASKYKGFLTGQDCYYFRCSLLHQTSAQPGRGKYSRILFVEPGTTSNVFHNNIMHDALNIDVQIFCEDIVSAVEVWLPGAHQLPFFATNLGRCVTRHPNGLSPYFRGVAVIG